MTDNKMTLRNASLPALTKTGKRLNRQIQKGHEIKKRAIPAHTSDGDTLEFTLRSRARCFPRGQRREPVRVHRVQTQRSLKS